MSFDPTRAVVGLSISICLACSDDGGEIGDQAETETGTETTGDTGTTDESDTGDSSSESESSTDGSDTTTSETTDDGTDTTGGSDPAECAGWQVEHPEWIFCDDFEEPGPLVADGRYFEYGDDEGDCVPVDDLGFAGSRALESHFEVGEVGAGGLKLGFGRNPNAYMNKGIRPDEDFREIWYRMYVKHEQGWSGDPAKLSRATVFTSADDWSQAMIAHLWGDGQERLLVDPVSCVVNGQVVCQGYNDFANMSWLGNQSGTTAIFSTADSGQWRCVEAHVRLDDPGQANGVQEFWIDGQLEASRDGMTFVGDYDAYAINAVFFENYWNDGSTQDQARWFDNIVVSTEPIGCL